MLIWAFTTRHAENWHPLTWMAHALNVKFWGLNPAAHHDVNVFLHAVNVLLLFWVLKQATGFTCRSFMVAALFALHPLNVEAVAWVAELKTLLSTLFFLLALGAYRWYAYGPRVSRYCVVASLFALGLMAKPQVIALPFVLLLWDYWPLGRAFAESQPLPSPMGSPAPCPARSFSSLVWEKVPLLVLCAADAGLTMLAQGVARPGNWKYSFSMRLGNAILSYARYVGKTFWPSALAPEYPYAQGSTWHWETFAALAFLLAVSTFVVVMHRRRYLVVGWLWFLVALIPMIGLIQVGKQSMADRYAYDSFLGLFIMICWGIPDWAGQHHVPATALAGVGFAALLALAVVTHRQISYWKDPFTRWSHAEQVVKNHWVAEDNLGSLLLAQGKGEEAMAHFLRAATISPQYSVSDLHIAIYDQQRGDLKQAIARYQAALDQSYDQREKIKICVNIAICYRDLGDMPKALEWLAKVKELRDAPPAAHGFLLRDR